MKKLLCSFCVLLLIAVIFSATAFATSPNGKLPTTWGRIKEGGSTDALLAPSKENVKLERHIFIDSYQASEVGGIAFTDELRIYKLFRNGVKWSATPVWYLVSSIDSPEDAHIAIIASAETWDDSTETELFKCWGVFSIEVDPFQYYGGTNTVSWASFSDLGLPPEAVAVCIVWYWVMVSPGGAVTGRVLDLAEFHIVNNLDYPWAVNALGVSDDQFDVQNVDTHEFGHTLFLDDLYMPSACELTMYGYVRLGETKKCTLGLGDKLGLWKLYGE